MLKLPLGGKKQAGRTASAGMSKTGICCEERDVTIKGLEENLLVERHATMRLLREIETLREELAQVRKAIADRSPVPHQRECSDNDNSESVNPLHPKNAALGNNRTDRKGVSQTIASKQAISGEALDPESVASFKVRYVTKDQDTKTNLESALRKKQLLGRLDTHQIRDLVHSMDVRRYKVGDTIIADGTVGDELYIPMEGMFDVIVDNDLVNTIGAWTVFGELALMYGCQRTATVKVREGAIVEAKDSSPQRTKDSGKNGKKNSSSSTTSLSIGDSCAGEVRVWYTDRRTFQMIMLKTGIMRQQRKLSFVREVSFFSHLKDKEIELLVLVESLTEERYAPGEIVFRQGAIGQTFYIVEEGELIVSKTVGEDTAIVATLKAGETFGERALQGDDIRKASVQAVSEVLLLAMGKQMFERTLTLSTTDKVATTPSALSIYDKEEGFGVKPVLSSTSQTAGDNEMENVEYKDFVVLGQLGTGGFGRVDLVHKVGDETKTYALKCLSKQHVLKRKQQAHAFSERDVHKTLKSPFVSRLFTTFRDSCYLYFLMEACLGGDVFYVMKNVNGMSEKEACFIAGCVIEALAYLHRRDIVYRDLKPENLMMDHRGYCKMIDFGFAKTLQAPAYKTWTFCGTPEYMAPETVLNKGQSFTTDIWALGVLIFELLESMPPFTSSDITRTYNMIVHGFEGLLAFPSRSMKATPKSLILSLCKMKPSDRLGAGLNASGFAAIRSHKWFSNFNWVALREGTLEAPIVPQLTGPKDLSNFDQREKSSRIPAPKPDNTGWDEGF